VEKLSYKTLFTIVVVLLIGIVALLRIQQRPKSIFAEWFDDAWNYRQAINISAHSVGETNVYISASVNIGTTAKSQSDNGDFRFTTASGQLLDYYIVSGAGTTNISFHINFDSLPAGAQTFYAYYGNLSAPNGFKTSDFSTAASGLTLGSNTAEEIGGGPIAWYKFDEGVGSTVNDSSQNSRHGSLGTGSSSPSWQTTDLCISGRCLLFDGTNDNVVIGDYTNHEFPDNTNFTISFWIYSPLTSTGTILAKKTSTTAGTSGYDVRLSSTGTLDVYFSDGTDQYQLTKTSAVTANTWTNISVVFDNNSATNTDIYINGTKSSATATGTLASVNDIGVNTQNLTIGSEADSQDFIKGKLDEIKLFPYARSSTQIKQDYTSTLASQPGSNTSVNIGSNNVNQLSKGLVGYWKMDENTGSTATDNSGNNLSGSISNSSWVAGKFGPGLGMTQNASTQNITVSDPASGALDFNSTTNFTISTWVKTTSFSESPILVKKVANLSETLPGYVLMVASAGGSNNVLCQIYDNDGATSTDTAGYYSDATLTDGNWHNIICTMDRNRGLFLYVDGVLKANDTTINSTGSLENSDNLIIGENSTSEELAGGMDETRIYNRAFSPKEVQTLYTWAPGPLVYFNLDETTGQIIRDNSGSGYTGVLGTTTGTESVDPTRERAKLSNGLAFDSSNDTATLSNYNGFDNMTLEAWIYPREVISSYGLPILFGAPAQLGCCTWATGIGYGIQGNEDRLAFSVTYNGAGDASTYSVQTSWSYSLNTWYHLVGVLSGTNVELYVNGVLEGSGTLPGARINTGSNWSLDGAYSGGNNFKIDEVKLYNYARTPSQIIEDMNGAGKSLSSPLINLHFDDGFGDTTNDSGIYNKDGNLGDGDTCPGGGACPDWSNTGKQGKALTFDGFTDRLSTPLITSDVDNISFSTWVNWSGGDASDQFIYFNGNTSSNGWSFFVNSSNNLSIICENNDTVTSTTQLTPGVWQHLVSQRVNGNWEIYLNSKKISLGGGTSCTPSTPTTRSTIGGLFSSNYAFNGSIDEFTAYNFALTQDQINQLYNSQSSTQFGQSSQTVGSTLTSLDYCIPGDNSTCLSPVAEYKFDEGTGTTAFDTSGQNNNGVKNGSPSIGQGKIGKSLGFTNNSDYVSINDNNSLDMTTAVTVETWIKRSSTGLGSWNTFFDKRQTNWEYWFGFNTSNQLDFMYNPGDASDTDRVYISSSNAVITDTSSWHHVAATYNQSTVKLFIDGVEKYSVGSTGTIYSGPGLLTLGASYGGSNNYRGLLDTVKIYNYARTPAQIAYDYDKGKPLAWYKLDECQGTTTYDSSGNGKNGTLTVGASGYQTTTGTCNVGTSAAWTTASTAKFNSGLSLDGTDDYVSIGNTATIEGNSEATVCTWLKYRPSTVTTDGALVSRYLGSTGGWIFWIDDDAALGGHIDTVSFAPRPGDGAGGRVEGSSGLITPGQWDHYCGVFKGGNYIRLYKNGKLDSEQTTGVSSTVGSDNANLYFGRIDNVAPRYLDGQIDDVRIYGYALNSSQIKAVFNGSAINFK
jgi:hypothetical protein